MKFEPTPVAVIGTVVALYIDATMGEQYHNRPGAILIADRNRNVRDFLRREFEAEGFVVSTAKNGEELIIMAHKTDGPDLVIMDLDLPVLDGITVIKSFEERAPALPVIVHSNAGGAEGLAAFKCVVAFIEKGENLELLKRTAALVIERKFSPAAPAARDRGLQIKQERRQS
jgi:DNA-binding NtrC family response regulator